MSAAYEIDDWDLAVMRRVWREAGIRADPLTFFTAKSVSNPPPKLPGPVRVGSVWWWMPHNPSAREFVRIVETKWDNDKWWVKCKRAPHGEAYWNELDRFIEAAVLIAPPEETP